MRIHTFHNELRKCVHDIVVVKKSRHEKYLFLISFFKSRHEEYFCQNSFSKVDMMIRCPAWSVLARDSGLSKLQQRVAVGTAEEVAATRKSVSVLLAERNQMCRLNK